VARQAFWLMHDDTKVIVEQRRLVNMVARYAEVKRGPRSTGCGIARTEHASVAHEDVFNLNYHQSSFRLHILEDSV
jgi:hypothetical protein